MVRYSEAYDINDRLYGIEDTTTSGSGGRYDGKRFQLWAGGCGIGGAATRDEARKLLYIYASNHVRAERDGYFERYEKANKALVKLGEEDPFNLGRFRK